MDDLSYVVWRFQYWLAKGDMSYEDIDCAVCEGTLIPGQMPTDDRKESP